MNLINPILTYSLLQFNIMKKEPFIFHSPLLEGLPRVTVVGQVEGKKLLIGAARCSAEDHFVKKIGVSLAKERITKGQLTTILELSDGKISYSEFIEIAVTLAQTILVEGLKELVLVPSFYWECLTKDEFDELGIEFVEDNNTDTDEEGFVLYEK